MCVVNVNNIEISNVFCLSQEPINEWRNVQGHNLLMLTYADPKRWNFTFQHYVQLSRLNLQSKKSEKAIQIFERSLQNNRWVKSVLSILVTKLKFVLSYLSLPFSLLIVWSTEPKKGQTSEPSLGTQINLKPSVSYSLYIKKQSLYGNVTVFFLCK